MTEAVVAPVPALVEPLASLDFEEKMSSHDASMIEHASNLMKNIDVDSDTGIDVDADADESADANVDADADVSARKAKELESRAQLEHVEKGAEDIVAEPEVLTEASSAVQDVAAPAYTEDISVPATVDEAGEIINVEESKEASEQDAAQVEPQILDADIDASPAVEADSALDKEVTPTEPEPATENVVEHAITTVEENEATEVPEVTIEEIREEPQAETLVAEAAVEVPVLSEPTPVQEETTSEEPAAAPVEGEKAEEAIEEPVVNLADAQLEAEELSAKAELMKTEEDINAEVTEVPEPVQGEETTEVLEAEVASSELIQEPSVEVESQAEDDMKPVVASEVEDVAAPTEDDKKDIDVTQLEETSALVHSQANEEVEVDQPSISEIEAVVDHIGSTESTALKTEETIVENAAEADDRNEDRQAPTESELESIDSIPTDILETPSGALTVADDEESPEPVATSENIEETAILEPVAPVSDLVPVPENDIETVLKVPVEVENAEVLEDVVAEEPVAEDIVASNVASAPAEAVEEPSAILASEDGEATVEGAAPIDISSSEDPIEAVETLEDVLQDTATEALPETEVEVVPVVEVPAEIAHDAVQDEIPVEEDTVPESAPEDAISDTVDVVDVPVAVDETVEVPEVIAAEEPEKVADESTDFVASDIAPAPVGAVEEPSATLASEDGEVATEGTAPGDIILSEDLVETVEVSETSKEAVTEASPEAEAEVAPAAELPAETNAEEIILEGNVTEPVVEAKLEDAEAATPRDLGISTDESVESVADADAAAEENAPAAIISEVHDELPVEEDVVTEPALEEAIAEAIEIVDVPVEETVELPEVIATEEPEKVVDDSTDIVASDVAPAPAEAVEGPFATLASEDGEAAIESTAPVVITSIEDPVETDETSEAPAEAATESSPDIEAEVVPAAEIPAETTDVLFEESVTEPVPSAAAVAAPVAEIVEDVKVEGVDENAPIVSESEEPVETEIESAIEETTTDTAKEEGAVEPPMARGADTEPNDVPIEEEAVPAVPSLPEQFAINGSVSEEEVPAETSEVEQEQGLDVSQPAAVETDEALPVTEKIVDDAVPVDESVVTVTEKVQPAGTAEDEVEHAAELQEDANEDHVDAAPSSTLEVDHLASDMTEAAIPASLVAEEAVIHANELDIDAKPAAEAGLVADEPPSEEVPVASEDSIPDVQVEMPTPSSGTFSFDEKSEEDVDTDTPLEERIAEAVGVPIEQVVDLPALSKAADSTPGNVVPIFPEEEATTPTESLGEQTVVQNDEAKGSDLIVEDQEAENPVDFVIDEQPAADAQEEIAVSPANLSVNTNIADVPERPKSPWTPSYSVTTQGPGTPSQHEEVEEETILESEEVVAGESVQENHTDTVLDDFVSGPGENEGQHETTENILITPSEGDVAADTHNPVEATPTVERPKSPYPPSYSVTQMGSGLSEETDSISDEVSEPVLVEADAPDNSLELQLDDASLETSSSIGNPESVDGEVSGASSNVSEAPESPRSNLGIITPGFDTRSEVSDASHEPVAPSTPRSEPDATSEVEMQTPVVATSQLKTAERALPTEALITPLHTPLVSAVKDTMEGELEEAVNGTLDGTTMDAEAGTSAFDGDVNTDLHTSTIESWAQETEAQTTSQDFNLSETELSPSEAVRSDSLSLVTEDFKGAESTNLDDSPVIVSGSKRDAEFSETVVVSNGSPISTEKSISQSFSDLDTIRDDSTEAGPFGDIPDILTSASDLAIPQLDIMTAAVHPIAVTTTFSKDSAYTQASDFTSASEQTGTDVTTPDVETLTMPKMQFDAEGSELGSIEPLEEETVTHFSGEAYSPGESASQTPTPFDGSNRPKSITHTLAMKSFPSAFTSGAGQTVEVEQSRVSSTSEDQDAMDLLSPPSSRRRLESTTSSLYFPGGWVASPTKERPSLEVATGVFSRPLLETTAAAVPPEIPESTPEEEKKWRCVIM